jgi:hypothetical protein
MNTLDNTAIIYGEAQSEGEKEKIIQATQNNADNIEKSTDEESNEPQTIESPQTLTWPRKHSTPYLFHPLIHLPPMLNQSQIPIINWQANSMAMARESDLLKAPTKQWIKD